jgi:hypothetical protein
MEALQVIDLKCEEEKRLYNCIFDLLSYEKITFNGMLSHDYQISVLWGYLYLYVI